MQPTRILLSAVLIGLLILTVSVVFSSQKHHWNASGEAVSAATPESNPCERAKGSFSFDACSNAKTVPIPYEKASLELRFNKDTPPINYLEFLNVTQKVERILQVTPDSHPKGGEPTKLDFNLIDLFPEINAHAEGSEVNIAVSARSITGAESHAEGITFKIQ